MIDVDRVGIPRGHKGVPTLPDWLTYLESLHPKTIALGLERVAQVWQRLNLQPNFPIITVGGTNGKGSVCAMLESMLHAAGYRVGCYTSPHLLDYNERVRIGKTQANDAELCASFEKIEQARGNISLTYFEFGTLAAMQCFNKHKVDVAVLEVGLGGRLDAVNVFDSDCAVVTCVDIDHTDYLGDTREKIAFEKAGIFRSGKVAVFGDRDVPAAIVNEARRIGAVLWRIGSEFDFQLPSPVGGRAGEGGVAMERASSSLTLPQKERELMQWDFHGLKGTRNALPYPALRGNYQLNNASAALAALDVLKDKLPVSMAAARRGLVEVTLPGRFQMVPGSPQLILDVAHNPHAARSLAQSLVEMPPCHKTFAVFAMLKDKDIGGVVRALKSQVDGWLVAGLNVPRGVSSAEMALALAGEGVEARAFSSIENALQHACNEASENDRIVAFGSFYTVAEVMRARGLRHA
jgi:dihydrofolate synthase/folylpolyglutamate synthase